MTAQNITAAEWDRLTRRARHWMGDVQPFAITRQIEGHKYLLVDVVATQRLARSIAGGWPVGRRLGAGGPVPSEGGLRHLCVAQRQPGRPGLDQDGPGAVIPDRSQSK